MLERFTVFSLLKLPQLNTIIFKYNIQWTPWNCTRALKPFLLDYHIPDEVYKQLLFSYLQRICWLAFFKVRLWHLSAYTSTSQPTSLSISSIDFCLELFTIYFFFLFPPGKRVEIWTAGDYTSPGGAAAIFQSFHWENSQTVTFADTNNNRNNNLVLAVGDLSCEGICEGNDLHCTKIKLFSSTCYTPTTFPFPSFWLLTRSYTPWAFSWWKPALYKMYLHQQQVQARVAPSGAG